MGRSEKGADFEFRNHIWPAPSYRPPTYPTMPPVIFHVTDLDESASPLLAPSSSDNYLAATNAIVIAETFIESLIIVLSLVSNLLVLISVFAIRGLRSKKTNLIFVLALTVADVLVTLFVMPFHVIQNAIGYWPFGSQFCDIFIGNDVFFCTASLLGIMCISIERYVAVFKPLRYKSLVTNRKAVGIVGGAWLASFILAHIPIQLHLHLDKRIMVSANRCQFDVNPVYALASSAISYWVPCLVMGFVYLRIYFGAKKQLDELCHAAPLLVTEVWPFPVDKQPSADPPSTTDNALVRKPSAIKTNQTAQQSQPRPKKTKGVTMRTKVFLGRILGCFVICWSPYFTLLVLDSSGLLPLILKATVIKWLFKAALWLSYANSIANPFIYAMCNSEIAAFWGKWRSRLNNNSSNNVIMHNNNSQM